MKIRKAELSDAKKLSHLALSLGKYYDDKSLEINPFFRKKITKKAFENNLANKEAYEHYVYEKDGEIIGYFALLNATHFLYLLIDEEYHKKGIGRALVEYALKDKDYKIYTVNASLYAVPFYKKLGFVSSALVQTNNGMTYLPMIWNREVKNRIK